MEGELVITFVLDNDDAVISHVAGDMNRLGVVSRAMLAMVYRKSSLLDALLFLLAKEPGALRVMARALRQHVFNPPEGDSTHGHQ